MVPLSCSPLELSPPVPTGSRSVLFPHRNVPLHAMLAHAGHEVRKSHDYSWDGRKRGRDRFVVVQWTIRGEGALQWDNEVLPVRAADLMLLLVPEAHRYFLPTHSASWEFLYVGMHGSEIYRLCAAARKRTGPLLTVSHDSPLAHCLVGIVREVLSGTIASEFQASRRAYALATTLLDSTRGTPTQAGRPPWLDAVERFCRTHMAEGIGVDDLAREAGYSRYHFSRLFAKHVGSSPGRFLSELRLQRGADRLRNGREAIKEIAVGCGYNDSSFFCRAFRRRFGVSPSQFRSRGL